MATVFGYLWAVFWNWFWLVTVILFGLDKFGEWMWPGYREWLNQTFPLLLRRKIFWRVLFVFVFISGFLAWKEEHEKVQKQQGEPAPTPAQIAKVVGQLTRRERVNELSGGDTIMLQHDPVPETVHLILGNFTYRVIDEKDCRLEGKRIVLSDSKEGDNKLSYATEYLADGDVKVEYLEQPQ